MSTLLCVYNSEEPSGPVRAYVRRDPESGEVRVSPHPPPTAPVVTLVMYDLEDEGAMMSEFEEFELRIRTQS